MPFDNRGRDLSATAANWGMTMITYKLPEARNRQGRILHYRVQGECGPANAWILDY